MLDDDIIQFWGRDNLVRWPAQLLEGTALPRQAVDFLVNVGLPTGTDWTVRLALTPDEMYRSASAAHRLLLGYDSTVPIVLDYRRSACIVALKKDGRQQFVNAGIREFALCLTEFQRYRMSVRGLKHGIDDQQQQDLVSATENTFQRIDPSALGDPANWWSEVVEQMQDGFL